MKAKWCFSSLLILLIFLEAVFQPETKLPNQEIVFQSSQSEATITIITQQLESLGANNIQVKNQDGVLKITYYSSSDIISIKDMLTDDVDIQLAGSNNEELPSKRQLQHQDFDIYEIQNTDDFDTSTDGFVVEPKSEADRFSNLDIDVSFYHSRIKDQKAFKEAYKIYSQIALVIDYSSYKIPEVRAGPKHCYTL